MASYTDRKELHQRTVLKEAPSKHNFLVKACVQSDVDVPSLDDCCQTVQRHGNNADFNLIKLIRFLYLTGEELVPHQSRVMDMLSSFSFWPHRDKMVDGSPVDAVDKTCFWSENHIFMYLSSSHLFAQKCGVRNAIFQQEEDLLKVYLHAHCSFAGVYEVNSPTYLPYTMSGLLNLYDFSQVQEIREKSLFLLDRILRHVLLVCSVDGICTLCASSRQSPRNRLRNYEHNINQVVRLVTGRSPDVIKSSAVTNFLLTSSFHLSDFASAGGSEEAWLQQCWHGRGFSQVRMNHTTGSTKDVFAAAVSAVKESSGDNRVDISEEDLVPFYWSAGLVAHPHFVEDSKRYLRALSLGAAPGVSLLNYLPQALASSIMDSFDIYASGQNYSDITLNVYKSPNGKVVMSSFDRYNVNLRSYQQNPWMINFDGAPLWSQSGRGGRRVIPGFSSHCPAISQTSNIMAVAYAAPSSREGLISQTIFGMFDNSSFVVWPRCYFDEEWHATLISPVEETCQAPATSGESESGERPEFVVRKIETGVAAVVAESQCGEGCWWMARRGESFLGLLCSHPTSTEVSDNTGEMLHMRPHPPPSDRTVMAPEEDDSEDKTRDTVGEPAALEVIQAAAQRRKCSNPNHVWVMCVGDTSMYSDMPSFIQHCTQHISLDQQLETNGYRAIVKDCSDDTPSSIQLEILK